MSHKILRNYVSEIDQFLIDFNKLHATPSLSQQKEINKYERIYFLRDEEVRQNELKPLWDGF